MSITYVSAELRRLVVARSERLCEYCLIAEDDTFYGCEVDYIISEKHGGLTQEENLAFACACCNWAKGSDVTLQQMKRYPSDAALKLIRGVST